MDGRSCNPVRKTTKILYASDRAEQSLLHLPSLPSPIISSSRLERQCIAAVSALPPVRRCIAILVNHIISVGDPDTADFRAIWGKKNSPFIFGSLLNSSWFLDTRLFGEFCSCCCLPLLPQHPCSILATWELPSRGAL